MLRLNTGNFSLNRHQRKKDPLNLGRVLRRGTTRPLKLGNRTLKFNTFRRQSIRLTTVEGFRHNLCPMIIIKRVYPLNSTRLVRRCFPTGVRHRNYIQITISTPTLMKVLTINTILGGTISNITNNGRHLTTHFCINTNIKVGANITVLIVTIRNRVPPNNGLFQRYRPYPSGIATTHGTLKQMNSNLLPRKGIRISLPLSRVRGNFKRNILRLSSTMLPKVISLRHRPITKLMTINMGGKCNNIDIANRRNITNFIRGFRLSNFRNDSP